MRKRKKERKNWRERCRSREKDEQQRPFESMEKKSSQTAASKQNLK